MSNNNNNNSSNWFLYSALPYNKTRTILYYNGHWIYYFAQYGTHSPLTGERSCWSPLILHFVYTSYPFNPRVERSNVDKKCLAQGHNCRAGVRTHELCIPNQEIKPLDYDTSAKQTLHLLLVSIPNLYLRIIQLPSSPM